MNLPFEVSYSEKPSKQSKGMKRLAVIVKPENVDSMIASLREIGLEATIYDVKGAGKDKQRIASGRGSGTFDLAYTSRKVVATVVKADDVDAVVDKMKGALAGEKGRPVRALDCFGPKLGICELGPARDRERFQNGGGAHCITPLGERGRGCLRDFKRSAGWRGRH